MTVSDNLQNKIKNFSKCAKDALDYAKLEVKIKAYKRECKKRYTKIGMLVYKGKKRKDFLNGEEIELICGEIDEYKRKIKEIKEQIERI